MSRFFGSSDRRKKEEGATTRKAVALPFFVDAVTRGAGQVVFLNLPQPKIATSLSRTEDLAARLQAIDRFTRAASSR